ncbi:cadherin EGF LAG seven-pass G-type receptor 2-like isoform X4 [Zootermopsis nevadensis]|uniref:cadherin EGF LAG seven-pass G-type receptor 2-like isoform X4 n=1 Tax=Zootermopsis nevadensis TaxID=136037 RepID=UPI000B8ECFE4|nr:cadherin EGF LAG seven-pass G-type receptor 2-like isoform X4 [Zootermopsis nevadensis]
MIFKMRIFSETFVLSVVFILTTINVTNGCSFLRPNDSEVNLDDVAPDSTVYIGIGEISDNEVPRLLYAGKTYGIVSFDPVSGGESKYLSSNLNGDILEISLTESYKDWESLEDTSFSHVLTVILETDCRPGVKVEFRLSIDRFTNGYPPTFLESSYDISLVVPLPVGSTIIGDCGVTDIEVTDFDYNNQYPSQVEFVLSEAAEKLQVSSVKRNGKKWAVSLKTTETFNIVQPLTFSLTAYDVFPGDTGLSSVVQITLTPNLEVSTPQSPLFKEPIHILDIKDGEDIIGPIKATLVEGFSAEVDVGLAYSHGENLEGFFDADISGDTVTVTLRESSSITELSGNFGVLILVATHRDTGQSGRTVIHVTLPGNYATPPPTTPPEKKWIRFRDPDAAVSVYSQQIGYIKTMSAFCSHDCTIEYHIEDGSLSDSLFIDPENGRINVTQNISEAGHFYVTAVTVIEEVLYDDRTRVHLNVMNLQPCSNGSQWTHSLAVKRIQEGLNVPYTLEKCDFGNGCQCTLESVIPEKAREYFTVGEEVILNNVIDREDENLFPDQSNTDIILHLEVNCESSTGIKTLSDLWNIRPQSTIDEVGSIEYNALRTVIVLKIEDENDNRPEFSTIASPLTVGYPNAEITRQLLPPFLTQVQAADIDEGENARIRYSLLPADQFAIREETGVIYPIAGAFKYEDTRFTVHASDAEGEGEPLEVNVKILNHDNLLVVKVAESILEDTNAILQKISSITEYNVKSLSAAVIADDDDDDDDTSYRQLGNLKSTRNSGGSILWLVVYGLNSREELVHSSDIKLHLDGQPEFKAETWTSVNNGGDGDGSSDMGLLPAVIALSVILAILLGGAVVVYVLYIRPKRDKDQDYYDRFLTSDRHSSASSLEGNGVVSTAEDKSNPLENVQFSSTMKETEPPPVASTILPRITTTEPDQELSNCTVLGDFDHGATDDFRGTSGEDVSENEDVKDEMTRRKSVVTFNDNVERIEIERL